MCLECGFLRLTSLFMRYGFFSGITIRGGDGRLFSFSSSLLSYLRKDAILGLELELASIVRLRESTRLYQMASTVSPDGGNAMPSGKSTCPSARS